MIEQNGDGKSAVATLNGSRRKKEEGASNNIFHNHVPVSPVSGRTEPSFTANVSSTSDLTGANSYNTKLSLVSAGVFIII